MAEIAAAAGEPAPTSLRTVIAASSAGTTFEWYDFFVFGSLTGVISKTFFSGLPETAGLAAALALFGAGFLFRPLGALVFGRIGDQAGRKGAFLATVLLMGGATVAIGLLPSFKQAGFIGPALLILMRIIQGFALGGEYGGAAIYVAEHAPANGRGRATSWIQTSAAFGLFGALIVILISRTVLGTEAFEAWGWRIPFLFSGVLLAVSIWMRLKLTESPEFAKLKAEGNQTKAPFREAFGQWKNLKLVLIGEGRCSSTSPDVIHLGHQSERTKRDCMAAAVALCQPSVHESLSYVVLESWLAGVPVLVHSDCAVTRKHVVKSGGGFHFDSIEIFRATIAALLSSPALRTRMGASGRRYVRAEYDWSDVLDRLENAFDAFIGC